jgi:hypothetical protein
MGLVDTVLPKPGKHLFARRVQRRLRRAGVKRPIEYDAQSFSLRIGDSNDDGWTLVLDNVYAQYLSAPRLKRGRLLDHFVNGLLNRPEPPQSFDEARGSLLPQVRPRFYHAAMDLHARLGDEVGAAGRMPHRVFAQHLAYNVAIDEPETIMPVTEKQFEEWDVGFDEALAIARENMWQVSDERWREPAEGVYVSPWQDSWDASRLSDDFGERGLEIVASMGPRFDERGDVLVVHRMTVA